MITLKKRTMLSSAKMAPPYCAVWVSVRRAQDATLGGGLRRRVSHRLQTMGRYAVDDRVVQH
eukprot:1910756-Prymnesium_polylepis.1